MHTETQTHKLDTGSEEKQKDETQRGECGTRKGRNTGCRTTDIITTQEREHRETQGHNQGDRSHKRKLTAKEHIHNPSNHDNIQVIFFYWLQQKNCHNDLFPMSHLKPPLHHTALNNIYISQVNGRLKKQMYLIKICIKNKTETQHALLCPVAYFTVTK